MSEKITITIPCEDKDWSGIAPTGLGEAIKNIEWGKSIDVPKKDLHKWTAQLRSVLSALEEAVAAHDRERLLAAGGELSLYCVDLTVEDKEIYEQLKGLGGEWQKDLEARNWPDYAYFNMDGIYPHYTRQPKKILFVGREACYLAGQDYMATVYADLIRNSFYDGWTLNQYPFNRRQFYIAYGILKAIRTMGKEVSRWKDLPWASDMAAGEGEGNGKRVFAVSGEDGISWAFMNLSKISNESGDYRTDSARYNPFVADECNRGFLRQEIRLLNPDIIIGANVYELIDILGYDATCVDAQNDSCYYYPPAESKMIGGWRLPPFLNCYHFAAIKSDEKCFYNPVMSVMAKHVVELGWFDENQAKSWRGTFNN